MSNYFDEVVKKFEESGASVEESVAHLQRAAKKGENLELIENLSVKTAEGLGETQELLKTLVEYKRQNDEREQFDATEAEVIAKFKSIDPTNEEKKALILAEAAQSVGVNQAFLMDPTVDGVTKFLHKPLSTKSATYAEEKAARHAQDLLMIYVAMNKGIEDKRDGSDNVRVKGHIVRDGIKILELAKVNGVEFIQKFASGGALDSLTAGEGAEWVPTQILSSDLINDIWLEANVASLFTRVPMTGPTLTLPRKKDFSTAYGWSQATAPSDWTRITPPRSSNFTTDNMTFTAKKVGILSFVSAELIADSIVAILEEIYADIKMAFSYGLDDACINGSLLLNDLDNASTDTNRLWNNTADAGDGRRLNTGNIDMRNQWNGIRKKALTAGSALVAADANFSALGAAQTGRRSMLTVRQKMGKYGMDVRRLAWVLSPSAYVQTIAFNEVTPVFAYGTDATIRTGALYQLDGIGIQYNPMVYQDLNATGVFDNTTKTKTEALLVHKDAYRFGERMGMKVETDYQIIPQQTAIAASMRLDFQKVLFDNAPTEGVLYNINS